MTRYAAVIFDMFGTLVDNVSQEDYQRVLTDMASVLSAPPDDFVRLWNDNVEQRMHIHPDVMITFHAVLSHYSRPLQFEQGPGSDTGRDF